MKKIVVFLFLSIFALNAFGQMVELPLAPISINSSVFEKIQKKLEGSKNFSIGNLEFNKNPDNSISCTSGKKRYNLFFDGKNAWVKPHMHSMNSVSKYDLRDLKEFLEEYFNKK